MLIRVGETRNPLSQSSVPPLTLPFDCLTHSVLLNKSLAGWMAPVAFFPPSKFGCSSRSFGCVGSFSF